VVDQRGEPVEVDLDDVVERDPDLLLDDPDQRPEVASRGAQPVRKR